MHDFLDEIVEELGDQILVGIDDKIGSIPTGSLSLDVSIGVGGIPRGKITQLYGSESSGKTTLALSVVRECLRIGEKALYVDAEGMLDYDMLVKMLGENFDKNRFVIITPSSAQEALRACELAFQSGEFGLVVLDSVGALAPQEDLDADLEDKSVALVARLITRFLKRTALPMIKKNNVAFLIINQVRAKIGGSSFFAQLETPGGHALKHFSSVIIMLSKIADITVGQDKVGINVKFSVKKNKVSAPFRSYTMPIIFGKGVDRFSDIVDFCTTMGVIKKSGAHYKFEGETIGQGKLNAGKFLEEHPEMVDRIEKVLYNTIDRYTSKDIEAIETEVAIEGEQDE